MQLIEKAEVVVVVLVEEFPTYLTMQCLTTAVLVVGTDRNTVFARYLTFPDTMEEGDHILMTCALLITAINIFVSPS